jgi:hypothetical protein
MSFTQVMNSPTFTGPYSSGSVERWQVSFTGADEMSPHGRLGLGGVAGRDRAGQPQVLGVPAASAMRSWKRASIAVNRAWSPLCGRTFASAPARI